MPRVEALYDTKELKRCIRDLIALSTLPVIWKDHNPHQIADSVAAALVAMLDSEFIYISLRGSREDSDVEVVRSRERTASEGQDAIREALLECLPKQLSDQTVALPNPIGGGVVRIASAPIGFGGDAILVAASQRPDFPTDVQRLLLGVAANEAAVAVQRWHAERDERRLAVLVENSSEFIGVANLDGVPQYVNPAGLKLVGLEEMEDVHRLHLLDFVCPEEKPRVRDELWPFVMREGRWIGEIGFRHFKSGAAIPLLVDWFRIDDPSTGQPMNIATISRDLTAQKRSEAELRNLNETLEQRVAARTAELEEANRKLLTEIAERQRADARLQELQLDLFHAARLSAAGQMAVALAHELNQPLTAAANYANAAIRGLANDGAEMIDDVRTDLHDAVSQVLRAGQIIRRLREFASRGETEKRNESVASMVEEAGALALTGANALGVVTRFCLSPDASQTFADRIQIQQVLVNLIRNAIEAMAGSSGRRELVVSTALLEERFVEIAVADSGPNVPKAVVDRLFEPFISTKRNGMGLGLSICRSIVESHGGTIRGNANPGGGMIFRFTLPTARQDEETDVG